MVEFYREYYEGKGMLENAVYDGIPEVLEQLKNAGIRLAVATSKPEKYARKIAEHFKIAPYFEFIGGQIWTEAVRKRQKSLSMC